MEWYRHSIAVRSKEPSENASAELLELFSQTFMTRCDDWQRLVKQQIAAAAAGRSGGRSGSGPPATPADQFHEGTRCDVPMGEYEHEARLGA